MAFNNDLKIKAPCFEEYGSNLKEGFNRGKYQTTEHYRAKLLMYKQQNDAIVQKHALELEVCRIEGKLELIEELFNESVLNEEKEKLESELRLAMAKAADLKVPTIDWFKLNEPQMYD